MYPVFCHTNDSYFPNSKVIYNPHYSLLSYGISPFKRFSFSSQLLNTLLLYLLDVFFSHLYHFHFTLSSYVLVLSKPVFFPLSHYLFYFSATLLLSPLPKKMRLGSTLLLGLHCTCYCLFLNEYNLILISTYFSDFNPLTHFSLWS